MGWKECQGLESCCLQEGLWALVTVGISATPTEGCASLKGASTWGWTVPGRWRSRRGADGKSKPPAFPNRSESISLSGMCSLGGISPFGKAAKGQRFLRSSRKEW